MLACWVQPIHIIAFGQESQVEVTLMWFCMHYPKSVWVHVNTRTSSFHRVSSLLCTAAVLQKWQKNLTALPPLIFSQSTNRATTMASGEQILFSLWAPKSLHWIPCACRFVLHTKSFNGLIRISQHLVKLNWYVLNGFFCRLCSVWVHAAHSITQELH